MMAKLEDAEARLDDMRELYDADPTVANELATLTAESVVLSLWASYMRAQGEIGQSLKCIDSMAKLAGPIAARRELLGVDMLAKMRATADAETSLDQRTSTL